MNLIFRLIKIVYVITDLFNVSTNTRARTFTHTTACWLGEQTNLYYHVCAAMYTENE